MSIDDIFDKFKDKISDIENGNDDIEIKPRTEITNIKRRFWLTDELSELEDGTIVYRITRKIPALLKAVEDAKVLEKDAYEIYQPLQNALNDISNAINNISNSLEFFESFNLFGIHDYTVNKLKNLRDNILSPYKDTINEKMDEAYNIWKPLKDKLDEAVTDNEISWELGGFVQNDANFTEDDFLIITYDDEDKPIEEGNLSHEGNCWVAGNARIIGEARVTENAQIYDNAKIFGKAKISGNTLISDNAQIFDNARISDNAKVSGIAQVYNEAKIFNNAEIHGSAQVFENAEVYNNAQVYNGAKVYGNAKIYENAEVYGNSQVFDYAEVYNNAKVSDSAKIYENAIVSGIDYGNGRFLKRIFPKGCERFKFPEGTVWEQDEQNKKWRPNGEVWNPPQKITEESEKLEEIKCPTAPTDPNDQDKLNEYINDMEEYIENLLKNIEIMNSNIANAAEPTPSPPDGWNKFPSEIVWLRTPEGIIWYLNNGKWGINGVVNFPVGNDWVPPKKTEEETEEEYETKEKTDYEKYSYEIIELDEVIIKPNGIDVINGLEFFYEGTIIPDRSILFDRPLMPPDGEEVSKDAHIYGNAEVFGVAEVFDTAQVYNTAKISDRSLVFENATIYGDSKVYGESRVFGNAKVSAGGVGGIALVYGNASVSTPVTNIRRISK